MFKQMASWMMRPFSRRLRDAGAAITGGSDAGRPRSRVRQRMGDIMALFTSTWRPRRSMLVSHLSQTGCSEVLGRNIDGFIPLFGSRQAYGFAGRDSARLTKRAGYFNAWQTVMTVRFAPRAGASGGGTTLICTSAAGLVARALTFLWLACGLIGIAAWFFVRDRAGLPADPRLLLAGGVVLLLAGVWLIAWLRWLSRGDHDWLLGFLGNILSARRA